MHVFEREASTRIWWGGGSLLSVPCVVNRSGGEFTSLLLLFNPADMPLVYEGRNRWDEYTRIFGMLAVCHEPLSSYFWTTGVKRVKSSVQISWIDLLTRTEEVIETTTKL